MYTPNPTFKFVSHDKFCQFFNTRVVFKHFGDTKDSFHRDGSKDFTLEVPGEDLQTAIIMRSMKLNIKPRQNKSQLAPGTFLWPAPSEANPEIADDGQRVYDQVVFNDMGTPQAFLMKVNLSWRNPDKPAPFIAVLTHSLNEVDENGNPKIINKKVLTKDNVALLDSVDILTVDVQCDYSWNKTDDGWKPTLYATKLYVHIMQDPFLEMYADVNPDAAVEGDDPSMPF